MTSLVRPPLHSTRLLDRLRERIRYCHYSLKKERAYVSWARRYIRFHGMRHPRDMGGAGLRLTECLQLRVKDVDFDRGLIYVREGKGAKDRVVMLPRQLVGALKSQIADSRALWGADRARNVAGVWLPQRLAAKIPRAGESWAWHWVFPAATQREPSAA